MGIINTVEGFRMMISATRIFRPGEIFKNKRVAVIGAADSAFEQENGDFIDGFDYVIRINKAPHSLTAEKTSFIGSKTDVLYHSFYENTESGGGPIDFDLYQRKGIQFLVNPNNNLSGLRTHLAYFKRNQDPRMTYILSRSLYRDMTRKFGKWTPTIGFSALYSVLHSKCKEVYITGFTFFKTPYADNYRDHFKDMKVNQKFIEKQGIHNPDLELMEFIRQLRISNASSVVLDGALKSIVDTITTEKNSNETA